MDEAIEDFLRSGGFSIAPGWSIDELFEIYEVEHADDGTDELRLRFREGIVKGPGNVIGASDPAELLSTIASESPRDIIVLEFNWDANPDELILCRTETPAH
jgi:hypothetical protein